MSTSSTCNKNCTHKKCSIIINKGVKKVLFAAAKFEKKSESGKCVLIKEKIAQTKDFSGCIYADLKEFLSYKGEKDLLDDKYWWKIADKLIKKNEYMQFEKSLINDTLCVEVTLNPRGLFDF